MQQVCPTGAQWNQVSENTGQVQQPFNELPFSIVTEAAHVSKYKRTLKTIDQISAAKRPHNPKKQPQKTKADKKYTAKWLQSGMRQRSITLCTQKRKKTRSNRRITLQQREEYGQN